MDYPGKVITKTQVTPTQTSASGNWTLDDQAAAIKNNNWPVALVPNPISKSLRFNSADSAYLNRTPASAGNRQTWTWSGWVKRGTLGVSNRIFAADDGSGSTDQDYNTLFFTSSDQIKFAGNLTDFRTTTPVYRDPSAWYHIVFVTDTTQATAANRFRLYVNGVEVTAFGTSNNPSQNTDLAVNANIGHYLGAVATGPSGSYLDGYMTEVNFIDGQALTPSSFGMTNPQTGQWIPLKYSGTYGTNGFYLNFKDATSTTTLGYDYSGNANNWTTNNFSVTAGAGNDSLTDVPTPWFAYNTTGDVGGVIRGNYCTWNPLRPNAAMSYANGNLDATSNGGSGRSGYGTFGMSSGKWYFETTGGDNSVGIANISESVSATYSAAGSYNLNGTTVSGKATYTTTDLIGCAYDATNGTIEFFKNGVSQGSSSFSAGLGLDMVAQFNGTFSATRTCVANFGQRPFAYTPPTGFRSLCTTNLPATAIGFGLTNQGNNYFDVSLWTGTSATQSITNSGSMQPDFVWTKMRGAASQSHQLYDSVRGVTKIIQTDNTSAEQTVANTLTSFNSNGFTLGSAGNSNLSTYTYVGWQWRASNATAVTNTAGTITSTVSANTTAGFSIVAYTGTGTNGATVGHGLGVAPDMIIVKRRNSTGQWATYHTSIGNTGALRLNATSATITDVSFWNNTSPASTVFTIGVDGDVNTNTGTYVAYCFDAVRGYSAFGSYTGNGSTDGPFVYTGFRPKFVLHKCSSLSGDGWLLYDTVRQTYNVVGAYLQPNLSDAEGNTTVLDILSNGFKIRSTFSSTNSNGATYIYAAFAESPFQFSNAR